MRCLSLRSQRKRVVAAEAEPRSRRWAGESSISIARSKRTRDQRQAPSSARSEGWSAGENGRDRRSFESCKNAPVSLGALLPRITPHSSVGAVLATIVFIGWLSAVAAAREVVDSAGRRVEVPDHIERVMAAGPPASVLVYMLAPEKMIGWNLKPREDELPYLSPMVRDLPEIGRLTGRGNTANLETVMSAKPGVILDFGSVTAIYVSLADRIQSQTGIPYLLIDGRFDNTLSALRLLGPILGAEERAQHLAQRSGAIFAEVARAAQSVPQAQHPRVYLARRPNGLETGNRGSINTEIIERAGGVNVVDAGREGGGLVNVSLEQVIQWNHHLSPPIVISPNKQPGPRPGLTSRQCGGTGSI